jgi:hypothetical protein
MKSPRVKPTHDDFWDHVPAFINEADDECSKMVKAGKLGDFEAAWADPAVKLRQREWFADARPIAQKVAARSVRRHIKSMVEYYRYAEKLLS